MRATTPSLHFPARLPDVVPSAAPAAWDAEIPETTGLSLESASRPAASSRRQATPLHLVMMLAFGQSLVFLVIWLFVCASAGAAVSKGEGTAPTAPALHPSVYQPAAVRDPFVPPGTKLSQPAVVAVGADEFRLDGILWHPSQPSAILNGKLVDLKRPVKVATVVGKVQVEAVEITRDLVKLKVDQEIIELRLGNTRRSSAPPRSPDTQ